MNNQVEQMKLDEKQMDENRQGSLVVAGVMILVGLVLFSINLGWFEFDNWWLFFMLIPAGMFSLGIYRDYQMHGRFTNQSAGQMIPLLAIMAFIAITLIDALTWAMLWPIGFIIAGVAILLGGRN